jgi:hypothetical protein
MSDCFLRPSYQPFTWLLKFETFDLTWLAFASAVSSGLFCMLFVLMMNTPVVPSMSGDGLD